MTSSSSTHHRRLTEPFFLAGGPTGLLIVHGLGGSIFEYREFAERLHQRGLTVSGMMLAGHGYDLPTLAASHPADWAASVDQAYQALTRNCSRIFILGASYGAMLALETARTFPVSGLILVNPAVSYRGGGIWQNLALQVLRLFTRYYKKPGLSPTERAKYEATGSLPAWPITTLLESKKYLQTIIMPHLPEVQTPALVLSSPEDRYVDARAIHQTFGQRPRTTVVSIPSHSHRPFREPATVDWLVEQVSRFITDLKSE